MQARSFKYHGVNVKKYTHFFWDSYAKRIRVSYMNLSFIAVFGLVGGLRSRVDGIPVGRSEYNSHLHGYNF